MKETDNLKVRTGLWISLLKLIQIIQIAMSEQRRKYYLAGSSVLRDDIDAD